MGEIMFRGNITMKGYLKNPSATEEAFAGGWFHTGDLAVMQPDSYAKIREGCHHFGRGRYFFYRGGGDAVVARPDEMWGQNAVRSSN
jgi:acyl-CoA synthetase (AMP-forming)/AMP-acid ligase II